MCKKKLFFLLLLFFLLVRNVSGADAIIGGETVYVVKKGDTLERIGAKFGVNWKNVARKNNIDLKKFLRIGQKLKINNRKIVPLVLKEGIVINIPDRMLYFFKKGKPEMVFPVGLGMPSWNGMTRWRTPVGKFKVTQKAKNPTWYVPESIQQKMKMQGDEVKIAVPPGKENPLGRYAVKTTFHGILIHETIYPASVYQFRSHGCIRVLPEHMENFFERIKINAQGEIIYRPVKVAVSEKGRVFLEAHKDVYERIGDLRTEAKKMIKEKKLLHKVNWQKVEKVVNEKSGVAEDVSL